MGVKVMWRSGSGSKWIEKRWREGGEVYGEVEVDVEGKWRGG